MIKTLIAKLAIREFWMFTIAGIGMMTLAVIGIIAARFGIPKTAEAVVASIVTLIGLRIGDVINAIRALWRVSQEHIEAEPKDPAP